MMFTGSKHNRTAGQCEKLCPGQQGTVKKNPISFFETEQPNRRSVRKVVSDSLSKRQRRFQPENRQQAIIVKRDGYTDPQENYDSGNN